MEDFIILGLLAAVLFIGIRSSVKHFRGEGGCCGGSAPVKRQRKKLKNVIGTCTVRVEGMVCEQCRNRLEKALNEIDGAAAKVSLSRKTAVISMERKISEEEIRSAIGKAGYTAGNFEFHHENR